MKLVFVLFVGTGIAVVAFWFAVYWLFPERLIEGGRWLVQKRAKLVNKSARVGTRVWPYLERAPVAGAQHEPVVLVHGFGADKESWAIYVPHIDARFRVVIPDLPGFGANDRTRGRDYGIDAQVRRLRDFLDALGIDRCHMSGNSMGGFIALRFADLHPERLASLTLFDNAGVVGRDKSKLQEQAERGENSLAVRNVDDISRLIDFVVYRSFPIPRKFRQVLFEEFNEHEALLDEIFWQVADAGLNHPMNDRLADIHTPTLIVWGRHDQLIDVSCADVLDAGLPNSEKWVLEKAGHVPMIEKPAKVGKRHSVFLHRASKTPVPL